MADTALGFVPLNSADPDDSICETPTLRIDCFNPRTIIDFGDVSTRHACQGASYVCGFVGAWTLYIELELCQILKFPEITNAALLIRLKQERRQCGV